MSPAQTRRRRNRRAQDRLKPSQVRLERMFHVGYLREGDTLRVNLDDTMYDFTIISPKTLTFRMPNGQAQRLSRGGGPFSLLIAAGLAVPAHVNRGMWDCFLVYRDGQRLGTLNQIRQQFWNVSERNRLQRARPARATAST